MQGERERIPDGVLALIDIDHFGSIVQRYGLTFGDVLLDEFARLIRQQVKAIGFEVLAMRAGPDEFLLWAQNGDLERGI